MIIYFLKWYATTYHLWLTILNLNLNGKAGVGMEVNCWPIAKGLFAFRPVTAIGFLALNTMEVLATLKSFPRFRGWCSVLLEYKLF